MTTVTYRLLASLQVSLMFLDSIGGKGSPLWDRYERAEAYLIRRANRDETPEEAEAYATIWPPVDIGGSD